MENEMTQEELNQLKELKEQNEILLAKLNNLQYRLQIKEYEEILNPIGIGVAGPVSDPTPVQKATNPVLDGGIRRLEDNYDFLCFVNETLLKYMESTGNVVDPEEKEFIEHCTNAFYIYLGIVLTCHPVSGFSGTLEPKQILGLGKNWISKYARGLYDSSVSEQYRLRFFHESKVLRQDLIKLLDELPTSSALFTEQKNEGK
jgi:hypothetical protein